MSLTYCRDTPLDREAFVDPARYLSRQARAPRVRLDSARIVQRHVNALVLARWFASAGGELLKANAGSFFGCPEAVGAPRAEAVPAADCMAWLGLPSTQTALAADVGALIAGTALASYRDVFEMARAALDSAQGAFVREWEAMQAAARDAAEEVRAGIGHQLRLMARENLLSELAARGVLPGHGLPTSVVTLVTGDRAEAGRKEADDNRGQRREGPSRTLDIAIRDYAPGAQVVIDGLVHTSAGVTVDWLNPTDGDQARQIHNIKVFWTCPQCGAGDCASIVPEHCPACHTEIPFEAQRRFLEPGGFTVDHAAKPHADTDEVNFVPAAPDEVVARGAAWAPLADPAAGRLRASSEGLVFFSSRGAGGDGYHVCLECGRAEPKRTDGGRPLEDHQPLRINRKKPAERCRGNDQPFKITTPLALGHEAMTDVAEIQPAGLETAGAAWAAVSALREALARSLGIETGEIGMAIRKARLPLGQITHSLYLFDRASGGAGFAPQAVRLFDALLGEMAAILDCREPGCTHGCSACVLSGDLAAQAEILDRKAALACVTALRDALGGLAPADMAAPDARPSRGAADEILAAIDGGSRQVILWLGEGTDIAALTTGQIGAITAAATRRGANLALVAEPGWLDGLDAAAKLALRDLVKAHGLDLRKGKAPVCGNGAVWLAWADGAAPQAWASRATDARVPGPGWGLGSDAPVVRFAAEALPLYSVIMPDTLLPRSGTAYLEINRQLDGASHGFGGAFAALVMPHVRGAGGGGPLASIRVNDRYLQSPLVVHLLTRALRGLADACGTVGDDALPLEIVTQPHKPNERQPFTPEHDWEWASDRDDVLLAVLAQAGFAPTLRVAGAAHGRTITLGFANGRSVRIVLDQGFGPWRAPRHARFDFGEAAARQAAKLATFNVMIEARGASYVVIAA